MPFVLGTDEAGYGPNLGPLVVAATAWEIPDGAPLDSLYDLLADAITIAPASSDDCRLAIADSKQLYKAGGTLAPLERGVLAALSCLARNPASWLQLWPILDGDSAEELAAQPWHEGYDEPLPVAVDRAALSAAHDLLRACLAAQRTRLVELQTRVLCPRAFNGQVAHCGNKAEVLSLTTLGLVERIAARLPSGKVLVVCDKHGGRDRYAALLQHVFPEFSLRIFRETRDLGVYQLRQAEREIEFRFLTKGERLLPTALASMTAKYARELAMRAFNAFWQRHVPNLRPTAGYPEDARRFRRDIRSAQEKLQIDDGLLWRVR
jgi:hypothetical protein